MTEDTLETKVKFLVDSRGRRTHAVLRMKDYEELLEDLHDLALGLLRKSEPDIPIDVAFARLKQLETINL